MHSIIMHFGYVAIVIAVFVAVLSVPDIIEIAKEYWRAIVGAIKS